MKNELEHIKELMDELITKMSYGEEDFSERLGRKKPEIEVMKVEGEMPEDEMMEDEMMPMEEDMEMEASPADKLKKRLMKLRG